MTHYYNYNYEMPPEIKVLWKRNWGQSEPKFQEWLKDLKKQVCGVHGELGIGVGWYGVRAQCLACEAPDEQERALHFKKKEERRQSNDNL